MFCTTEPGGTSQNNAIFSLSSIGMAIAGGLYLASRTAHLSTLQDRAIQLEREKLLLSITPHMHYRAHDVTYELVRPSGEHERLLVVPHYDFNWQNRYELAEPRRLRAGTTLRCTSIARSVTNTSAPIALSINWSRVRARPRAPTSAAGCRCRR